MQNRDLYGLALNSEAGGYVSISISANAELLIFSEQGELEKVRPLAALMTEATAAYKDLPMLRQGVRWRW